MTEIRIKLGAIGQRVSDKGITKPNEEIMECTRSIKQEIFFLMCHMKNDLGMLHNGENQNFAPSALTAT